MTRPDARELLGLGRSLALYYGRPWRLSALRRFYSGFVGRGDLAFDIGAHVGNRTRALRAAGAHVIAVEPQPLFHRFLRLTLPRDRVTLLDVAVGAAPGQATLNVSRRHPTVSTLSRDWIGTVGETAGFEQVAWDRGHPVQVTTLDRLIAAHGLPKFCKIDVEGFEPEILAGLGQPLPALSVEYLPAALDRSDACIDRLAQLGPYRFNVVRGEATRFLWPDWLTATDVPGALRHVAADGRSGDLYARLQR